MSVHHEVLSELTRINPDALLLEPREMYDKALVGMTDEPDDHWPRTGAMVAVYDRDLCIEVLREELGSYDAAVEWFEYNTSGAWVGPNTPTFICHDPDD